MKRLLVLAVLATSTVSFAAYADRIENAFERDRVLARFDLDANAEGGRNGYIELEGRVRNAAQRNRARAMARRVAPGYRLVNRIQISSRAGLAR
jgi:hypothetical protein